MSELLMELSQRARALPAEERAALAELLLESIAEPAHPSVQAAIRIHSDTEGSRTARGRAA